MRNRLYDRNLLPVKRLSRPVISVGNLNLGGSGKTPLVQYLAQELQRRGWAPAVVSRGYRGSSESGNLLVSDGAEIFCTAAESGDEPYLMARRLSGVAVAVGKYRWKSARLIEQRCPAPRRVFLLDDGFQHRKLARDLNILVIDASAPPFSDRLLPAGNLREPITSVARADVVFLSRCHLARSRVEGLEARTRELAPDVPVFSFGHRYRDYRNLADNRTAEVDDLVRSKVVVLAALGNPRQFLDDLARAGLRVVNEFLFRDHHPYSQQEIDFVLERARRLGAEAIITTEKDAVRLEGMNFGNIPFWALRIEPYPLDQEHFSQWLDSQMEKIGGSSPAKGMEP